ncbi:hypothetical protein FXO38_03705 [Capsicum annuum]|nr:hypothetical protein FXO38_03705 [Capsicum annuum]
MPYNLFSSGTSGVGCRFGTLGWTSPLFLILKGKRKPLTSASLMMTKKIFSNSGPSFVNIIDQGLASLSFAQPIQGAACFLSATSGLCSGRHSYMLLLAPLLKNLKVTFGCCCDALVMKKVGFVGSLISTPSVMVRLGPVLSVSSLPANKISEINQPAGLVWLFFFIENESVVCASHLLLGSTGRHGAHLFPKIEYLVVGKDPPLISVRMRPRDPRILDSANSELLRIASRAYSTLLPTIDSASASRRSNGAQLVSARRDIKNITNTENKGILDHICFCAMTILLELREPTHISTVYWGSLPEPHVQVSLHVAHTCFPRCACDSAWEKEAKLRTFMFRELSDQVAECPSLDKKQNALPPTVLSLVGDFHEMKTGGIIVCSTFVALVYIPEYSFGRSVTKLLKQPKGLAPSHLENDPLWHDLVNYSRSSNKIQIGLV